MQNDERDLRDRTKRFALSVIRMFSMIPKTTEAQVLGRAVRDFLILPSYFVLSVILRQMTSSLFVSRQLPLRSTATLAA